MPRTTPNGHAEAFAAFVEEQDRLDRERAKAFQEQTEWDESPDDPDDAWAQYDEEQAAEKAVRKGSESSTDWIKDFAGFFEPGAEPETGDQDLAEAPHQQAPAPEPEQQRSAGEAVEEAVRVASSRRELRQDCPSFWTNKKLANCREIRNDTELKAIGLLNTLMQKHGYAYVSNEQFAVWMRMKNSESARHLLARLTKRGLIENIDRRER
jgi:hypothetical protein